MNGCGSIRIFTLGNLAEKHKGEDSKRSRRTLWRRLQATDLPGGQHRPDACSWTICWRSDVGLMIMMMMIHTHLRALDGARSDQKREWGWIITQGVPLLFCRRHQRHGQQVQQWQHQRQGRGTKKCPNDASSTVAHFVCFGLAEQAGVKEAVPHWKKNSKLVLVSLLLTGLLLAALLVAGYYFKTHRKNSKGVRLVSGSKDTHVFFFFYISLPDKQFIKWMDEQRQEIRKPRTD